MAIRKDLKEDLPYLELIAKFKWGKRYRCKQCGFNKHISGKIPYSRRCSKCKYDESPFVGTAFEGIRFPISKAMQIFEVMQSSFNEFASYIYSFEWDGDRHEKLKARYSTTSIGLEVGIQQKTAWLFLKRVIDWLPRSFNDVSELSDVPEWFYQSGKKTKSELSKLYNLLYIYDFDRPRDEYCMIYILVRGKKPIFDGDDEYD